MRMQFRTWDKRGNAMEQYYGLQIAPSGQLYNGGMNVTEHYIIMQFTGLKDCKRTAEYPEGQEIYEGDICKQNGNNTTATMNPYISIVFLDGAFCVKVPGEILRGDDSITIRDLMFQARRCGKELELEVIGNIHDNPELLQCD